MKIHEIINEINLKAWSGLQKSPTTIDRVDLEIQWENNYLVNKRNKIFFTRFFACFPDCVT